MKVTLLAYTPNPADLCAIAAKCCYLPGKPTEMAPLTPAGVQKMLDRTIKSGHLSVIEHASFTFAIEDVSRSMTHQLVRHRIATFSQQSQRFVQMDEDSYVVPPFASEEARTIFIDAMGNAWEAYNRLQDLGENTDFARSVLPNACKTNIIMTMNAHSLLHFLGLRMCNRASKEIQGVANEMQDQLMKVCPQIFKYSGPNCWFTGCTEEHPCGNPPDNPHDFVIGDPYMETKEDIDHIEKIRHTVVKEP